MPFRTSNKIFLAALIIIGSIIFMGCGSPQNPQSEAKSSYEEPITQEVQDPPIEGLSATAEEEVLQIDSSLIEETQPEAMLTFESNELVESNPEGVFGGGSEPVEKEEVKSAPTADPSLPSPPQLVRLPPIFHSPQ